MTKGRFRILLIAPGVAAALSAAVAQEAAAPAPAAPPPPAASGTPPYEARLLRLSEILGSLQYLRSLCLTDEDARWRQAMEELLQTETAEEPARRAQLTAGYNRGYRAFAAVHTACSEAAVAAETRYRQEGEALAAEIVARFGN